MTSDTGAIEYPETHDLDQLAELMRSAGWNKRADDRALLEREVSGPHYVVSARDGA